MKKRKKLQGEFEKYFAELNSHDPSYSVLRAMFGKASLKDRAFAELVFLQGILAGGRELPRKAISNPKKSSEGRKFIQKAEREKEEARERFSEIVLKAACKFDAGVFASLARIVSFNFLNPLRTKTGSGPLEIPTERTLDDPISRIVYVAHRRASFTRFWRETNDSPSLEDMAQLPAPSIREVMREIKALQREGVKDTLALNTVKKRLQDLNLDLDKRAGRPKGGKTKNQIDRGGVDPHRKIHQKNPRH